MPTTALCVPGSSPTLGDATATKVLAKGETIAAPPGRADNFAWPADIKQQERKKGTHAAEASETLDTAASYNAETAAG
jgi:hypothetical protein